jgi:hypothetical protein
MMLRDPRGAFIGYGVLAFVGILATFFGSGLTGGNLCDSIHGCPGPSPILGTVIFFSGVFVILVAVAFAVLASVLLIGQRRSRSR